MPDDNNYEMIDDIISDMNIETITLDDVQLNTDKKSLRENQQNTAGDRETAQKQSSSSSPAEEEISFEPFQIPLEEKNENVPIPNLDSIQSIPEPEIPEEKTLAFE